MYLVTGLLSEVLTNNAAAALMYPIAANVGDDMGIEVRQRVPGSCQLVACMTQQLPGNMQTYREVLWACASIGN